MSARNPRARGARAALAAGCFLAVLSTISPRPAVAGLRLPTSIDPLRCGAEISGQDETCQFRFHPAGDVHFGSSDELTVRVTLRDAFDVPVQSCSTSVTLAPVGSDTHNFCTCCGDRQGGFTDAMGTIAFTWDRIGGFGTLEVQVTAHCAGNIGIAALPLDYTSSDLTGTCGEGPTPVDILDIALWARGMESGGWIRSDWDCSGGPADIVDAGRFAYGLYDACGDGGGCP